MRGEGIVFDQWFECECETDFSGCELTPKGKRDQDRYGHRNRQTGNSPHIDAGECAQPDQQKQLRLQKNGKEIHQDAHAGPPQARLRKNWISSASGTMPAGINTLNTMRKISQITARLPSDTLSVQGQLRFARILIAAIRNRAEAGKNPSGRSTIP